MKKTLTERRSKFVYNEGGTKMIKILFALLICVVVLSFGSANSNLVISETMVGTKGVELKSPPWPWSVFLNSPQAKEKKPYKKVYTGKKPKKVKDKD